MKKNLDEIRELAIKARQPEVLYECFDYIIEKIPHNYRATIKCAINPKEQWRGIDRDCYTHPEHGLDYAKEIVEHQVKRWFLSGVVAEQPEGLKTQS